MVWAAVGITRMSWRTTWPPAWRPPLKRLISGRGMVCGASPVSPGEVGIEGQVAFGCRRAREGDGDGEDRVGAEAHLFVGAVERDQRRGRAAVGCERPPTSAAATRR